MKNKQKRKLLLILFVPLLLGTASLNAQTVSKTFRHETLKNVLKEVERQTKMSVIYKVGEVNENKDVSASFKKTPLREVLSDVLDEDLGFEIQNKIIIIHKKSSSMKKVLNQKQGNQIDKKLIKGKIVDDKGEPIFGANVVVRGNKVGTASDVNGEFEIEISGSGELVISYIGYKDIQVPITRKSYYTISLLEDRKLLNDVVVVGYGTQKKVNLTGSVASVTDKSLDSRPITRASDALAGLVSGVTVSQSEGRPGSDGATIRVRGQGTFSSAGSDPLVLIDGLSASFDDIDPNNIKSISVLKDAASAAIYGTRAANGVILIETKRGQKGKTQVSYNGYFGWQKASELPDFVSSSIYAQMKNESDVNQGKHPSYSDDEIKLYRNGSDPDNYPNVNHLKDLVTSGSGFQTGNNISFTGGGENFSYLLSLGYLHQLGIVARDSYNKYNFQFNLDNQITRTLHLKADIGGYTGVQKEPRSDDSNVDRMIGFAVREPAIIAGRKSDGTYGYQDNFCPEGWLDSSSFSNRKSNQFMGGIELEWNPIKNFYLSAKGGYKYYNYYDKDYVSELVYDANKTYTPNNLTVYNGWNTLVTLQSLARYSVDLNSHHIAILGGVSQEEYKSSWGSGYRKNFPNDELYELNAGSTTGQVATGSATEWALRSFFGRVNYSYKGRYLFEANARYDGTSRFPSDRRWGFFPSVSAGWRLSEESFIKDNLTWIDNLKIRASWGRLGNQNIGNYPYQNVLSLGQNYPFGNSMSSGASVTTLANSKITWEKTDVTDLGFDMTVLKGMFDVVFDVYNKKTSDILYKIETSSVLGMTPSEVNSASVRNKGLEMALNYHTKIGNVQIGVSPNFSYTKNEVVSLGNGLKQDINDGLFVGKSLGAIYGYVADGLFVDQADIDSYAPQPYSAEPGFIRLKDISGAAGTPDGTVDATNDRKVIGSTLPKYTYGLTFNAEYKNFDLSCLLSGMGGYKNIMSSYQAYAFYNSGNIQKWQVKNRWTTENPSRNAKYIKLTSLSGGSGVLQTSTYWLRNASFLRVKNIQLGYTIPQSCISKLGISQLRVYFSGQNLFCLKSFYKGWDPEMSYSTGDQPSFYPITAVYTFGLNIKF